MAKQDASFTCDQTKASKGLRLLITGIGYDGGNDIYGAGTAFQSLPGISVGLHASIDVVGDRDGRVILRGRGSGRIHDRCNEHGRPAFLDERHRQSPRGLPGVNASDADAEREERWQQIADYIFEDREVVPSDSLIKIDAP